MLLMLAYYLGCCAYLAHVIDKDASKIKLEDIPVVKYFSNIFREELPGLPPDRDIEFTIDLIPKTVPLSQAPYRTTSIKLKKLKVQLQELVDNSFIRPRTSLWGASVLFVKKERCHHAIVYRLQIVE